MKSFVELIHLSITLRRVGTFELFTTLLLESYERYKNIPPKTHMLSYIEEIIGFGPVKSGL